MTTVGVAHSHPDGAGATCPFLSIQNTYLLLPPCPTTIGSKGGTH